MPIIKLKFEAPTIECLQCQTKVTYSCRSTPNAPIGPVMSHGWSTCTECEEQIFVQHFKEVVSKNFFGREKFMTHHYVIHHKRSNTSLWVSGFVYPDKSIMPVSGVYLYDHCDI